MKEIHRSVIYIRCIIIASTKMILSSTYLSNLWTNLHNTSLFGYLSDLIFSSIVYHIKTTAIEERIDFRGNE